MIDYKTMKEAFHFFRTFLKHPLQVSSVIPTSKISARNIAKRIRERAEMVVVEYGPGTGVVSEEILQHLPPDALFILVEMTEEFAARLREKFTDPRVVIECDSAANVETILGKHGKESADYIFSSIPIAVMPEEIVDDILQATWRALADDGVFITFLVRAKIESKLRQYFSNVRTVSRQWLNIPPLVVREASKNGVVHTKNAGENGVPPAL